MISDTLHDAVVELDGYLADGYGEPELRGRILELRHRMDGLRVELDTLPTDDPLFAVLGRSGPIGLNLQAKGALYLADVAGGFTVPMHLLETLGRAETEPEEAPVDE